LQVAKQKAPRWMVSRKRRALILTKDLIGSVLR
jgi:hypothetical protein